MDSTTMRYDVLLLIQVLGSVILVASLFYSGLSLLTVLGGVLIMAAITGMAAAAVLGEREAIATATRDRERPAADPQSK